MKKLLLSVVCTVFVAAAYAGEEGCCPMMQSTSTCPAKAKLQTKATQQTQASQETKACCPKATKTVVKKASAKQQQALMSPKAMSLASR